MTVTAPVPTTTSPVAAPWLRDFLTDVSKAASPEFVLSTVHGSSPRARYCVFRGMWGQLPDRASNPAPLNEAIYESECITLTTDVRMEKTGEIGAGRGSGGGGPVEAVFWSKEAGVQWRVRGRAWVVAEDIGGEGMEDIWSEEVKEVRRVVGERMKVVSHQCKPARPWSWQVELTAHFGNLKPIMRGTFKNPAPGTPISVAPDDSALHLGQLVDDLHDPVARANFRVVLIVPDEVEKAAIYCPESERSRWKYNFVGLDKVGNDVEGGWKKEELWP